MKSDNLSSIMVSSVCDTLEVDYQNASSGAFRGDSECLTVGQYGFNIDVRLWCGAFSAIWLTDDSWGQLQWVAHPVPTAQIQQRELLTQVNGSTFRVFETYSTFDSITTTTRDICGMQRLCVSLMGVHRDVFDAGLCSNITTVDGFQAMDLQYDAQDDAVMVRYCTVTIGTSTALGLLDNYKAGWWTIFYNSF